MLHPASLRARPCAPCPGLFQTSRSNRYPFAVAQRLELVGVLDDLHSRGPIRLGLQPIHLARRGTAAEAPAGSPADDTAGSTAGHRTACVETGWTVMR